MRRKVLMINARFVHTNLIARDWRRLSEFYCDVFGCVPVRPERHYSGPDLERGTGVAGSELHGVHLQLPGYGDTGPTLEVYTYSIPAVGYTPAVNRPGFGHIAFEVSDLSNAREAVLKAGGGTVGDIVTLQPHPDLRVTWCYLRDPEGNIIELQSWDVLHDDTDKS
jgi:catechol 2,3-dioxygenase-like lactoylglutathione lyase family enzyme